MIMKILENNWKITGDSHFCSSKTYMYTLCVPTCNGMYSRTITCIWKTYDLHIQIRYLDQEAFHNTKYMVTNNPCLLLHSSDYQIINDLAMCASVTVDDFSEIGSYLP